MSHRRAELKSLVLHREVAHRLRADPSLLERARMRVAGRGEEVHSYYREQWSSVLAGGIDAVCALLEADDDLARDLRQTSPFAGAPIDPPERHQDATCATLTAGTNDGEEILE